MDEKINTEVEKPKFLLPIVKWVFRFAPMAILSLGLVSMVTALQRQFKPEQLSLIELGWPGDLAFWLYNHLILWSSFALVFAFVGILCLFVGQSTLDRSGRGWGRYVVLKHLFLEHLAEILMLVCGGFFALGYHEHLSRSMTPVRYILYIFVTCFTATVSYFYFFCLENEKYLQTFINKNLRGGLEAFGAFALWFAKSIK